VGSGEAGFLHLGDGIRRDGLRRGAGALHVHAEIDARLQRAGGDDGHDGDEGFEQHAAVADGAGVTFARDDLGRGAAGDKRVETGDRPARDGDEAEGEELAGHDEAAAVNERAHGGHLQVRQHNENPQGQRDDGAELHEGAQVITRREQQPHG
jgi:hypothetical protein